MKIGTVVPQMSTVGAVANLRDEIPVSAHQGGIVVEWSAEDGDPVTADRPLLGLPPRLAETTAAAPAIR